MTNQTNKLKQSKGFTLVEILIVVIIVGLLAGIAVSKLGDNKERAVIAVKKSAATEINKAIQAAYVKGASVVPQAAGGELATIALLGQLQNLSPAMGGAPFTLASAQEVIRNLQDVTPNTGNILINAVPAVGTGGSLRDVEVVWTSAGTTALD